MRLFNFVAMLSAIVCSPLPAADMPPWEGDKAPGFALQRPSGETVEFPADAEGKASVLLFWATWCPYCRKLMPHLQQVADEYRDRPVKFYALNVWEDGDPVAYMQEHGFTFDLLLNADLVAEDYGVQGTPGLFVLDSQRVVRYIRASGTTEEGAADAVRAALEASLP